MASSLNKAIIVGNLGKDPEVRTFQSGGKVANFSVATTESWKDRQTGENKERTEWHKVAVFGDGTVDFCQKYLRKGSKVLVEGKIQTRKYQDQSGQDRFATEIVVQGYDSKVISLDQRQQRSADEDYGGYGSGSSGSSSSAVEDDDLPF